MTANEIRTRYLKFFESRGHKIIPSAPLIPENDPTVLFTTAGMHPLVPFLLGEKHPLGKRLVNSQKCIRTGDIDDVGDSAHLTFFEMLGNWSLGDYFKREAIEWSFDFLTKELNISLEKLAFTVFEGEKENNIPRDNESFEIWKGLGVKEERIKYLGREDNWWGPAGATGPCGPDTEMFYWTGKDKAPEVFDPSNKQPARNASPARQPDGSHGGGHSDTGGPARNASHSDAGGWVEIWNDVFMQYNKTADGKFEELTQKNVDTGMGLERIAMVLQGKDNVYETELFASIIEKIEQISSKKYQENEKVFRIIADHLKASVFILADGLAPSNTERGYVLRRLIRRAIRYGKLLGIENNFVCEIAKVVIEMYKDVFSEVKQNESFILNELQKEEEKFRQTLEKGLREINNLIAAGKFGFLPSGAQIDYKDKVDAKKAFYIYQSFGFPLEMIKEELGEKFLYVEEDEFREELKKHQELSRTASAGQFKSGLADNSEMTTKYHTATHLLLAALRAVFGGDIQQKGSNITAERIRFDFNFNRKMTEQEIKQVEEIVNEKIKQNLPVVCNEMEINKALESGAVGVFGHKYGERVKVYSIGQAENVCSKEICAGPHIQNTSELGEFKIVKEEASSSGVRRIKAILQ